MKKNLLFKVLTILAIASFALAACASPATEAPAATEAPEQATEAPAVIEPPAAATDAPAEGEVALRWRTRPDNQEEIGVYSQISKDIDAELDGIALTYEPGGTEGANYQDQLRSEIAAGALISIGGVLSPRGLWAHLRLSQTASVFKLAVSPAIGYAAMKAMGVAGPSFGVGMVFFALPTSTALYILSSQLNSDTELASAAIVVSTLLSVFSLSAALLM